MSENTKKVLKNKKVDSIIIPGGLTGLIQAPDVSWNAPFKAKLRELYNKWMANAPKSYTKSGNVRAPSREAFAGVSEFWDKDLEYFEALTTAESQLILADNHHFENNDLFVI